MEKIHELAEYVITLFSGIKNCEQTKGYIKIVFVDKMSKVITMNRHKNKPFRWPGYIENLIFFDFIAGVEILMKPYERFLDAYERFLDVEDHVIYLTPPTEKIHELTEFVKTLFSGVKNCKQTKEYIKIVFVDKMSEIITLNRHKNKPFRWPGYIENLIFLDFIPGDGVEMLMKPCELDNPHINWEWEPLAYTNENWDLIDVVSTFK